MFNIKRAFLKINFKKLTVINFKINCNGVPDSASFFHIMINVNLKFTTKVFCFIVLETLMFSWLSYLALLGLGISKTSRNIL